MSIARRLTAGTLAAGALALSLSGCGNSVDPIERLGRKTASASASQSAEAGGTGAGSGKPSPAPSAGASANDAYKKWGLAKPLEFAAKPAQKPQFPKAGPGKIPVVNRIPVPAGEKTVFLTFDDGAEKNPEFLKMAADLKLPITMFLTDDIASSDYGHFQSLRDNGSASTINNHTLSHPNLPTLSFAAQKKEICGQQERLEKRFGKRPTLFRPPYGNYNDDTLRAASECGLSYAVLWQASMQINSFQYQEGSALKPGDIILAHFRGPAELKGSTEIEMTTRMLQRIQEQGYKIGRLDDYL
ncbi:polysaccharide deacetylase family protein [Streptomyces sp. NBC_00536]|uniref:polysaccharide deacetylase family protein n=1 Tax=Streptomyces sp. NBC_00536 TaxID=2975769 RepID=UPI002E80A983|nr:polysaccharide deacetylase family protein [Streptomyces sp. NBC_00536]WUC80719.1 polysaccharide deacetylase family protein [Streptomyces sp. NBC_00536]